MARSGSTCFQVTSGETSAPISSQCEIVEDEKKALAQAGVERNLLPWGQ